MVASNFAQIKGCSALHPVVYGDCTTLQCCILLACFLACSLQEKAVVRAACAWHCCPGSNKMWTSNKHVVLLQPLLWFQTANCVVVDCCYLLQDMNQLMSLFTAKPWRQGSVATFKFMFRQKAVRAARQGRGSQTCKPPKTPGPPQHQQQGSPEKEGRASNPGMSLVEVHVDCPEVLISPTSQRRAEAVPGNVMTEALLSPTLQRRRSASVPGGPQQ